MKKLKILSILIFMGLLMSCSEDFLETAPTNQISDADVFVTAEGAQTVLDGIYRNWRFYRGSHDNFGMKANDLARDLMGEDIIVYAFHWFGYDYNLDNKNSTYRRTNFTWDINYETIYNANSIIANIDDASSTDPNQKWNIKAQALAARAFAYMNLAEMYQHTYVGHQSDLCVPIYTEPTTESKPRATVQEVYDRIVTDLEDAIELFTDYPFARIHMSHIDLGVANGLRARVALIMNEWDDARTYAAAARAGIALNTPAQFSSGFDSYSQMSWMWGLEVNDEQSTIYASFFSHIDMTIPGYAGAGYSPKGMSDALYNLMDPNDVRTSLVVSPPNYWNLKFAAGGDKEWAADYVMMRPEEMLLIEAEANARLGGAGETTAQNLLKELWDVRYSTAPVTAPTETGQALIDLILLERRIELWAEGFRLGDIKRLKIPMNRTATNIDVGVAGGVLSVPAESDLFIYQLPQDEIDNNDFISESDQNP